MADIAGGALGACGPLSNWYRKFIAGFQHGHAIQKLEIERRYIGKDPRQDSGQRAAGIFRIRDIRRNVLPKFIEICMETPCWCSPG